MNRQIRVKTLIGTVKCVVTCDALVHGINWLAKRKTLNDFTVYLRNMI